MYQGKVDLHLHLDGSLSVPFVQKYLQICGLPLPGDFHTALSVTPLCRNLNDYLERFSLPKRILQYADALEECAYDLVSRLALQGILYAEIRFAPAFHCELGLTQDDVVQSVIRGTVRAEREYMTIKVSLLLCMIVGDAHNKETLRTALRYHGNGVAGLDLAGPEGIIPLKEYSPLFESARAAGLPFTIHAGECGDADNVLEAVRCGASRIGHGVAAIKSPFCMEVLKEKGTILECCFTSNIQTRAVKYPEEHPIYTFFRLGLRVTVNTDNMTVSDTTLAKEYSLLENYFGFSRENFLEMERNALHGSFLSSEEKRVLLNQLCGEVEQDSGI